MDSKENLTEEIMKVYETMTAEKKRALHWLIRNFDLVEDLCYGGKIAKDKMTSYIEKATNEESDTLLMVLRFKKFIDGNGKVKSE